MMGFYAVCPGSGQYVITTPEFDKITIRLSDSKYFTIKTVNRNDKNYFINSVTINVKKYSKFYLTHEVIMKGSEFAFKFSGTEK